LSRVHVGSVSSPSVVDRREDNRNVSDRCGISRRKHPAVFYVHPSRLWPPLRKNCVHITKFFIPLSTIQYLEN
jgi:hypothetical protein